MRTESRNWIEGAAARASARYRCRSVKYILGCMQAGVLKASPGGISTWINDDRHWEKRCKMLRKYKMSLGGEGTPTSGCCSTHRLSVNTKNQP